MTARKPPQHVAVTAARRRAWAELSRRLLAPPEREQAQKSQSPTPQSDERGER